jgi:tRNA-specific 2-thiouridylase
MSGAIDKFMSSGREWEPAGSRDEAVAVMMSGGIDSSVTAAMLKRSGRDVVGVTMQIPSGLGPACGGAELRACCGSGASEMAGRLGIPHYFIDVRDEFRQHVIEPFREAYRAGRTPSPCIDCNTHIKFDVVMQLVRDALGIQQVATGHYARISPQGLRAAIDKQKDQSYFLYGIRRDALPRILFPLGRQTKDRTRELAASYGLDLAGRSESVELCFAGQSDYRAALGDNPDAGPGDVLDLDGNVIGTHKGISQVTIGQREGLGIAGGVPLYVVAIDPESNTVTLGGREAAGRRDVRAHNVNVLAPEMLPGTGRFLGKIRSRLDAAPCTLTELTDREIAVEFDEPEHGVCPGQHLVLYTHDGQVVAGGTIARSL